MKSFFYAVWRHLPLRTTSRRLYLYIGMQVLIFVYQNGVFTSRGCPRALVTYVGTDKKDNGAAKPIKISVALSRPLSIHPGQYISLRMPAVSWWSWTQSHPFMVTSWVGIVAIDQLLEVWYGHTKSTNHHNDCLIPAHRLSDTMRATRSSKALCFPWQQEIASDISSEIRDNSYLPRVDNSTLL
jgi:hypothetical protein